MRRSRLFSGAASSTFLKAVNVINTSDNVWNLFGSKKEFEFSHIIFGYCPFVRGFPCPKKLVMDCSIHPIQEEEKWLTIVWHFRVFCVRCIKYCRQRQHYRIAQDLDLPFLALLLLALELVGLLTAMVLGFVSVVRYLLLFPPPPPPNLTKIKTHRRGDLCSGVPAGVRALCGDKYSGKLRDKASPALHAENLLLGIQLQSSTLLFRNTVEKCRG